MQYSELVPGDVFVFEGDDVLCVIYILKGNPNPLSPNDFVVGEEAENSDSPWLWSPLGRNNKDYCPVPGNRDIDNMPVHRITSFLVWEDEQNPNAWSGGGKW